MSQAQAVLDTHSISVTVEQPTGIINSDTLNVTVETATGVIKSDTLDVVVESPTGVIASDTLNVTVEQPTGVIDSDTLEVIVEEAIGVIASDILQVIAEQPTGVIDSDSLQVTVSEPAPPDESEAIITQFNTFTGPFPPATNQIIAEAVMQNSGDTAGDMNIVFAELDQNGNVIQELCRQMITDVASGAFYTLERPPNGECIGDVTATEEPAPLRVSLPTGFGEAEHYGLKTWSNDEQEPDFPSGQSMTVQTRQE